MIRFLLIPVLLIFLLPVPLSADFNSVGMVGALRGAPDAASREAEQRGYDREVNQTRISGINNGIDMLNTGLGLFDDISEFTDAAQHLNPDDAEFDPDYSPDGAPTIPVSCPDDGSGECQQCYSDAYRKLNFVRFYLERLRAIYGATTNYASRAIAFGDSTAGINGGFGLAWPAQRAGIEKSVTKFKGTYDKKYRDYMKSLQKALKAVDKCEAKHFGTTDWYSRFGFIYYTYMQDRYRRD